jgi:Zn-dependent M28 family amino/carboxypeptidase
MLTCAERLLRQLPEDVELQLVGTGAEEVGCCGMRGFVARHSDWSLESTYFVNFECVGGGLLHFICSEGVLRKVHFPPMLLELARRVAASGAFAEVTPTHLLASTDGHVPAERGYPSLSLISLDSNGVPLNYHRIEDTADGIDPGTVVRAADFGAAVAMAALRAEAGPIATVKE